MPVGLADPACGACLVTVCCYVCAYHSVYNTGSIPNASLSGSVRFCPLGVCPICLFWLLDRMQNISFLMTSIQLLSQ